jgi:hypothetical protein
MSNATNYVSIDKILEQVRKLAPDYALVQAPAMTAKQQTNPVGGQK